MAAAMTCHGSHRGIPRQPTWYSTGDHGRPWVPMAVAMGAHGRPRDPTAASGTPREDRGMSWQLPLACTVCTRAGSRECSGGNTHGAHDVGAHAAAHVAAHMTTHMGVHGSPCGSPRGSLLHATWAMWLLRDSHVGCHARSDGLPWAAMGCHGMPWGLLTTSKCTKLSKIITNNKKTSCSRDGNLCYHGRRLEYSFLVFFLPHGLPWASPWHPTWHSTWQPMAAHVASHGSPRGRPCPVAR